MSGWACGYTVRSRRIVEPQDNPVDLSYIRDRVLRVANGNVEDDHIQELITAVTGAAEDRTGFALPLQTWELTLSGFPPYIKLPRPPLVDVLSFTYIDPDGVEQSLAVSPADFLIVPSTRTRKAQLHPLYGAFWPATRLQPEAVTITYTAGFVSANDVPAPIRQGIGLMVGELYSNPSLSVTSLVNNTKSVLQLERFWKPLEDE